MRLQYNSHIFFVDLTAVIKGIEGGEYWFAANWDRSSVGSLYLSCHVYAVSHGHTGDKSIALFKINSHLFSLAVPHFCPARPNIPERKGIQNFTDSSLLPRIEVNPGIVNLWLQNRLINKHFGKVTICS